MTGQTDQSILQARYTNENRTRNNDRQTDQCSVCTTVRMVSPSVPLVPKMVYLWPVLFAGAKTDGRLTNFDVCTSVRSVGQMAD